MRAYMVTVKRFTRRGMREMVEAGTETFVVCDTDLGAAFKRGLAKLDSEREHGFASLDDEIVKVEEIGKVGAIVGHGTYSYERYMR